MTTLISWIGVDSRGPSSLYLASDSKITWGKGAAWEAGRKLFACNSRPVVLAYCGDVLSPTQILSQLVDMIDGDLLPLDNFEPDGRAQVIGDKIWNALSSYPPQKRSSVEVLLGHRVGEQMMSSFHLHMLRVDLSGKLSCAAIDIGAGPSRFLAISGTGANAFLRHYDRWQTSKAGGTSRAIFSALCDALKEGSDKASGGPPQLVGLYRIGVAKGFGVIWEGRRHYYGSVCSAPPSSAKVAWHNDLFEICDPATLGRKDRAQPQPRPEGL
jgi:hypothetical protein